MEKNRPIVGITMGDPFGNGPEISVSALSDPEYYERCRPIVIGDTSSMEYALKVAKKRGRSENITINTVHDVADAKFEYGTIDVYDLGMIKPEDIPDTSDLDDPKPFHLWATPLGGDAAFNYVKTVIELAMDGKVDATVTNALNKEGIHMAGHNFDGHTEIYAHYTNTKKYTMMLAHNDFRVVHVSTHVSLREACDRVKKDRVLDVIRIADDACKQLGIENPRIAVAGLNPHCGENGLFGREEIDEIQPAIDEAIVEGINIPDGHPQPPDSVFSKVIGGLYDIVVAMYHDQGHIPTKVIGFRYNRELQKWDAVAGINVTLGLPIIRASVDHGTGMDIAGAGLANDISLRNSIDYAIRLAENRKA